MSACLETPESAAAASRVANKLRALPMQLVQLLSRQLKASKVGAHLQANIFVVLLPLLTGRI
jgi:hypothetical protein